MSNLNIGNIQKITTLYKDRVGKYNLTVNFKGIRIHNINKLTTLMHYHSDMELIYVLSGKGLYTSGSDSCEITLGDIHLCHENVPHEIVSDPFTPITYAGFLINISNNTSFGLTNESDRIIDEFLKEHQNCMKSQKQLFSFFNLFDRHIETGNKFDFVIENTMIALILEIIYLLTVNPKRSNPAMTSNKTVFETALEYIQQHLFEKIYVKDIADACYTSVRNLQLLFRKNIDKTIIHYINEKRIDTAKNYLKINTPIKDTAYKVGIEDPSRFSKLFKQYTGVTPRRYQKNNSINTY